jgi:hypothetical protein
VSRARWMLVDLNDPTYVHQRAYRQLIHRYETSKAWADRFLLARRGRLAKVFEALSSNVRHPSFASSVPFRRATRR